MSKQNDGGPAFPAPIGEADWMAGMSLRDYFASQCASGLFIRDRNRRLVSTAHENAQFAYEMADAMIEARKPPNT
ncbi:MAG: hypothetical protein E6R02_05745 [Gammaproteobacteria bacterium]|nr:MAG: hypothetical protein E6R02_05745 [Gammaproteobacteria bacterium]